MDNLISMDQIQQGFEFRSARVNEEVKWQAWYDGKFQSLFNAPTIDNGLKLFEMIDLIKWNPFFTFANLNRTATISDPPLVSSQAPALKDWLDVNFEYIFNNLLLGCEHWSIKDLSVWITFDNGTMDAIDPSDYFRVGKATDPDQQVGHIIIQRYVEPTTYNLLHPNNNEQPNRAKVWRYMPREDINDVQIFRYSGSYQAGNIEAPITTRQRAGITSLVTTGRGNSWFGQAGSLVARVMTQLTNTDSEINHYINQPLFLPGEVTSSEDFGNLRGRKGPPESNTEKLKRLRETVRPMISVGEGVPGLSSLYKEPIQQEQLQFLQFLIHLVQATAGNSPQTQGFDVGGQHSGVAIERMQDPAAARSRLWRRGVEQGFPEMIRGLGAPPGDVRIIYHTKPFEDRKARNDEIRTDYKLGIIALEVTQQLLGYEIHDVQQAPQDPAGGAE